MTTYTTLRDYSRIYTLMIDCPACRHHSKLEPMRAAQVAGWDCTLPELRQVLRCSRCGTKGAEVRIAHGGAPG